MQNLGVHVSLFLDKGWGSFVLFPIKDETNFEASIWQ